MSLNLIGGASICSDALQKSSSIESGVCERASVGVGVCAGDGDDADDVREIGPAGFARPVPSSAPSGCAAFVLAPYVNILCICVCD